MNFKDTCLIRQEVILDDDVVNALGPGLILDHCHIISNATSRAILIGGFTMNGGVFDQKHSLQNFHFERAHFSGVRFTGSYSGCDFGDWDSSERPSIVDCDFTEAKLDGVRFLQCDVSRIQFPKWPCFVIVNPVSVREHVLAQSWPNQIGLTLDVYTDEDPECVAVVGDAARIAKQNNVPLDDLRDLMMQIPGIVSD